jgi:hypothetical protein
VAVRRGALSAATGPFSDDLVAPGRPNRLKGAARLTLPRIVAVELAEGGASLNVAVAGSLVLYRLAGLP